MAAYTYPSTEELMDIESSKTELLNKADKLAGIMPITNVDDWQLRWRVEGYAGGLQQLRGLNGDPGYVARVGPSDYLMKPGVYGEYMTVDEEEMTRRAANFYPFGGAGRIDIGDLIMQMQDQLLDRRYRLINYIRWTLLGTGTFAIADRKGAGGYRHTDTYSIQTYSATTWATSGTATPLYDFRQVKLLGLGLTADFGANATAFMNQVTFNNMIGNTNAADLGGQRVNFSPLVAEQRVTDILLSADLPRIVIVEDGYYNASGTFVRFLATGTVIVVGAPTPGAGELIGQYRMTFNAISNASGPYMETINRGAEGPARRIPPIVEVHDGHTGGPVLLRPHRVVAMTVS